MAEVIEQVKKRLLRRIKELEKRQGSDDGTQSDRDWDIEQAKIDAKRDAYLDCLAMLS